MFRSSSGYYSNNRLTLEKEITEFLRRNPSPGITPEVVMAPHGNMNDCGDILGKLYSAVKTEEFNNVVILGPSPVETGPKLGFVDENFQTPLGEVDVDTNFTSELEMSEVFQKRDDLMHLSFVEMQLIFLQMRMEEFRIIPVTVSNKTSDEKLRKGIKVLKRHLNDQDLVVACSNLASSDKGREDVHKKDSELLNLLREQELKKFSKKAEKYNMGGWKAVLTALTIKGQYRNVQMLGHRVRTPEKILESSTTGYAGVCFER